MTLENRIQAEVARLVEDLVHDRIEALQPDGRLGRLTVDQVREGIAEYPGKLTEPAADAFGTIELIKINSPSLEQYALQFDLWVDGRPSDLTVTCTVTVTSAGALQLELDDLHVL